MPLRSLPSAPSRRRVPGRWIARALALLTAAATFALSPPPASAQAELPALRLRVLGGLASVKQYTAHERPFWSARLAERSGGRMSAEIAPFDESGVRANEMLQMIRIGVVPFGTLLVSVAANDEPLIGLADLPGLNPTIGTLRRTVATYRPLVERMLRQRHGIQLLAIYTYPAQTIFCAQPFAALDDLRGRRIRTSSALQSTFVEAIGGRPVILPFATVAENLKNGAVDCAVTGTMSGNSIGLPQVTTHLNDLAIQWGLTIFAAHAPTWDAIPPAGRDFLAAELAKLEAEIWAAAETETQAGIDCNTGRAACVDGRPGRMRLVPTSARDREKLSATLQQVVIPKWRSDCGDDCAGPAAREILPIVDAYAKGG